MKTSLVAVGGGRGFVVRSGRHRYVITAAHCLSHLPTAEANIDDHEAVYPHLLGEIGAAAQTVWAECTFVDPVADIAILCSPDPQQLWEEADQYEKLLEPKIPLRVAAVPHPPLEEPKVPQRLRDTGPATRPARLISITCDEFTCRVEYSASCRSLWIEGAEQPIVGGMSGSPILDQDGDAIGIVCVSAGFATSDGRELGRNRRGGPNPRLTHCLPGWFLMDELQQQVDEEVAKTG